MRAGELRFVIEPEVTRVWLRAGSAQVRRLSDGQHLALEVGRAVEVSEHRALVAVDAPRASWCAAVTRAARSSIA